MKEVTKDNWQEVTSAKGLVLVDFWAVWCQPCKMQFKVLEQLHEQVPHVEVVKVDADSNPELVEEFGVSSIPTLMLYKNGELIWTEQGAKPLGVLLEKIAPHV